MKSNERVLFGFILAPILLCGGFLLWFVRHNLGFENFALASLLLISLIITAFLNIRKIRNSFLDPMSRLTQQLDEPALSINPSGFEPNTPFHHLASSLQERINHNDEVHRDRLSKLSTENQKRHGNKQSHQHQAYLIEMSQLVLADFIGLNNLQRIENSNLLQHDLDFSSRQIVFLLREMQAPSFRQAIDASCNPFQECDEAIRLIWPLLQAKRIEIIPVFEEGCPREIGAEKDSVKSLVLNFILNSVLQKRNIDKKQSFVLNISVPNSNTLHIALSGSSNIEGIFSLPIKILEGSAPIFLGLKTRVISDTEEQKQSIESRLLNLGFELTESNDEIDMCFIYCQRNEDVITAGKTLDSKTLVLLSNNETYYNREGWHPLASPILQNELHAFLTDHYLIHKEIFDRVIALDRANKQSELMEEMLDILMSTLSEDRSKIIEASESEDIEALQKIIHKMEGGLLYTGASRLEHTIGCLSKVIKRKKSFDETQIIPLITKIERHIVELQNWYLSHAPQSEISQ